MALLNNPAIQLLEGRVRAQPRTSKKPPLPNSGRWPKSPDALTSLYDVDLRKAYPGTVFHFRALSPEDFRLCFLWSGSQGSQITGIENFDLLANAIGEHEAARLVSARSAELVAIAYYRSLGYQVEDVSLKQLSDYSGEWQTHDLRIGSFSLDVKNARRSPTHPSSYSELTLPRFKQARESSPLASVGIVGILSNYLGPNAIRRIERGRKEPYVPRKRKRKGITPYWVSDLQRAEVHVLGALAKNRIETISSWASDATRGRLSIVNLENPAFLPGWFFEYPHRHYKARETAVSELPRQFRYLARRGFAKNEAPFILQLLAGADMSEWSWNGSAMRLLDLHEKIGLSRLSLVTWALSELVRAANGDVGARLETMGELVFGPLPPDLPALLFDKECYVREMLDAATSAWQLAGNEIKSLEQFQLSATGVLRGRRNGGDWTTIISYCGGTSVHSAWVKCAKAPLVRGINATCVSCRRLICDSCGYCGSACKDCQPRQSEFRRMFEQSRESREPDEAQER